MEKISPKMAAAFGVGFIGFIMAAYSYNKHHKPDYADNLIEKFNDDDVDGYDSASGSSGSDSTASGYDSTASASVSTDSASVSGSGASGADGGAGADGAAGAAGASGADKGKKQWGTFWKSEYENIKNINKRS